MREPVTFADPCYGVPHREVPVRSWLLLALVLAPAPGCFLLDKGGDDDDDDEDDDTGRWVDTVTDRETDIDTAMDVSVTYTDRGVDLRLTHNPGYTWLGIIQQETDYDWEAEACTGGQAGYDFCHPFDGTELHLRVLPCMLDGSCTEADLDDMDASADTLFHDALEGEFAWVIMDDMVTMCLAGGDAVTYYTDLGCPEL